MKKIYTITFHRSDNHGALLQAYALQSYLNKEYESKILDYDSKCVSNQYKIIRKLNKNIFKTIYHFIYDILHLREKFIRKKDFDKFRKDYLLLTDYYSDIGTLKKKYPKVDAYIVGSDQIWNPKITNGLDDIYTLNFGEDFKKIAYAASVGKKINIESYEGDLKKRISRFNAISVRESQIKDIIEKISDLKTSVTLDPVFLLSKEEWKRSFVNKNEEKNKYIFFYTVESEKKEIYDVVNYLSDKTHNKVLYFDRLPIITKIKKGLFLCKNSRNCVTFGPSKFLNCLYYSDFVVTSSFHGISLSIILNKDFYAVIPDSSERIISILQKFGLLDRIVHSIEDIDKIEKKKIDWTKVNNIIKKERENSINWLVKAIEE